MRNASHYSQPRTSSQADLDSCAVSQFQREWIAAGERPAQPSRVREDKHSRYPRFSPWSTLAAIVPTPFERHKFS